MDKLLKIYLSNKILKHQMSGVVIKIIKEKDNNHKKHNNKIQKLKKLILKIKVMIPHYL